MNVVESAILSTDLAMYFKKRDKFLELIDNGEFDWQSEEKKERKLIESLKKIISRAFSFVFLFLSSFMRHDDDGMWCKLIGFSLWASKLNVLSSINLPYRWAP